jgi:hypothetical protein
MARPDLPISRLGDLYRQTRWQPERGPGNLWPDASRR